MPPHGRVILVQSFLSALGEAARQPLAAVIGPAEALSGMAHAAAESLRRLAPKSRLVIVDHDPAFAEHAAAAQDAGFDARLDPDADDRTLADELGLTPRGASADTTTVLRPADPADVSEGSPRVSDDPADLTGLDLVQPTPTYQSTLDAAMPAALSDPVPATTLVPTSGTPSGTIPETARGKIPGTTPGTHSGTDDDEQLGDTDLVDLILRGEGGLDGLALRMVRAQAGLPDAQLAAPETPVPEDHLAVPVGTPDQGFGRLHAPPPPGVDPGAVTDRLRTWADWLVRWLRLDAQFNRLRDLAMRDELTGAWNRRYFNHFLRKIIDRAAEDRQQVTLLVFDIDDFKRYNDAYGHAAGDEILRGVAKLMRGCVREHDVVARIGGDEFAVIFWDAGQRRKPDSKHPDDVINAAKRFQRAVIDHRFPKLLDKAAGNLTISGGLAGFPWDGRTPEELLDFADTMAMRSKQQGKNAITVGPGARADSPPG